MRNRIVEKYPSHSGFTSEELGEAICHICAETGFKVCNEVQRRFIYNPDKTWRVRFAGTFEGKPALLRVENLRLETDEESIRATFRAQTAGTGVRPPHTYATSPFDRARGYAWSIDEHVTGPVLFMPSMRPQRCARDFGAFYKKLRDAVLTPFWPNADHDAHEFTRTQVKKWIEVAGTMSKAHTERIMPIVKRLRIRLVQGMRGHVLGFQHPHLSGMDVRKTPDGEYVVFANHMWGWRQPGYDVAFPIWGQWLALPEKHRTARNVREITDAWLGMIRTDLAAYVLLEPVKDMLLNRLIGALLLDIPAQRGRESPSSVTALERALIVEARRLLA